MKGFPVSSRMKDLNKPRKLVQPVLNGLRLVKTHNLPRFERWQLSTNNSSSSTFESLKSFKKRKSRRSTTVSDRVSRAQQGEAQRWPHRRWCCIEQRASLSCLFGRIQADWDNGMK